MNDPERTAAAFLDDPLRPGERLYRSGDIGRWRPDGKLEFLGRRDSQVKVRGFRVELGEVETALSRLPDVRRGRGGGRREGRGGAAWSRSVTARRHLDADVLRARLADSLPATWCRRCCGRSSELPLTANGKVDEAELRAAAQHTGTGEPRRAQADRAVGCRRPGPRSSTSPSADIGPDAHFADLGGTSLTAVRLVVALDRAVTLATIRTRPVLADLARRMEGTPR